MSEAQIVTVVQDAITTILLVSLPMLGIGLAVGILISIIQATTQINEQTIVFVSKIFSVFAALLIFGPWMLRLLTEFTARIYGSILPFLRG